MGVVLLVLVVANSFLTGVLYVRVKRLRKVVSRLCTSLRDSSFDAPKSKETEVDVSDALPDFDV